MWLASEVPFTIPLSVLVIPLIHIADREEVFLFTVLLVVLPIPLETLLVVRKGESSVSGHLAVLELSHICGQIFRILASEVASLCVVIRIVALPSLLRSLVFPLRCHLTFVNLLPSIQYDCSSTS